VTSNQPYYELDYHGTDGGLYPVYKTTEEKAADYIREIRTVHPRGPYHLCGFSYGGMVAMEMARQLTAQGEQVPLLFLLDPSVPGNYQTQAADLQAPQPQPASRATGRNAASRERIGTMAKLIKISICKAHLALRRPVPRGLRRFYMTQLYQRAARQYVAKPYGGPVILYHTHKNPNHVNWKALFAGELEIHHLSKGHMDFIEEPHIEIWARRLIAGLQEANRQIPTNPQ
jgi:thioesterase domain-containing protein